MQAEPDLLKQAIRESTTLEEAAARLGISAEHVRRLAEKFGIRRQGVGPGKRISPAVRQKLIRAIDQGMSRKAASQTFGVAKSTASREARRAFEATQTEPTSESPFRRTRPYRCLTCGQRVELRPCMICWHQQHGGT